VPAGAAASWAFETAARALRLLLSGVPVTRIAEIVHQRRGITPDTALRLGRYFNTRARFWMNGRSSYELEVAQDELQAAVERDVQPRVA